MAKRFPFPGIPSGWYVAATSAELKRGTALRRRYFDRELVLYRTASGVPLIADGFCPHMGAHLGRVGRVEGEVLRCGFHGFRYDASGACVATGYGGPPPARARLRHWEVREQNGLVLVWFDAAGRDASWEVPALDDTHWNVIRAKRYRIGTTPQETTENSVDLGHFTQLHGFVAGWITRTLAVEGPYLRIAYAALRPVGLPGLPKAKLEVRYDVKAWGLGYSQVDVEIPALGFDIRVWVLPVPIDEEHIELRLGAATSDRWGWPAARLTRWIAHRILCDEVDSDLDIWNHKTFVETPPLAKGDGPVMAYRQWARQFYAPRRATSSVAPSASAEAAIPAVAPPTPEWT